MAKYYGKIGDKFNRLTIKALYYREDGGQNKTYAKCLCDCGNETDQRLTSMVQGKIKSCGCHKSDIQRERAIKRNTIHRYSVDEHKRLFAIWLGIKYRCFDTKSPDYIKYGARGIKVVDEWLTYENFRDWSLANGHSKELTLDRLDSNYHYSPDNCRWATFEQQLESKYNNRQILAFNEVKSLLHWTRDPRCKNDIKTIKKHLAEGKSPEEAMSA